MELTIIITAIVLFLEIMGVVSAIDAIMKSRTSQGAVAWVISLVTIPIIVVPLYWIFGRNKFRGYVKLRNSTDVQVRHVIDHAKALFEEKGVIDDTDNRNAMVLSQISDMPLTRFNSVDLLIDGQETFAFCCLKSRTTCWCTWPPFLFTGKPCQSAFGFIGTLMDLCTRKSCWWMTTYLRSARPISTIGLSG